jgi:hypothetical protein
MKHGVLSEIVICWVMLVVNEVANVRQARKAKEAGKRWRSNDR